MRFIDVAVMALIITGAIILLYRSVWKKQGHCPGCDAGACGAKGRNKGANCQ